MLCYRQFYKEKTLVIFILNMIKHRLHVCLRLSVSNAVNMSLPAPSLSSFLGLTHLENYEECVVMTIIMKPNTHK